MHSAEPEDGTSPRDRIVVDPKAVIKLLTAQGLNSLEVAVARCVKLGHREVTVEHLIAGMLELAAGDFPRTLELRSEAAVAARAAVDEQLAAIPARSPVRPTFSPLLILLLQDGWSELVPGSPVQRIRTGSLVALLFRSPARYGAKALVERLRSAGALVTIDSVTETERATFAEERECRSDAPKQPPTRLPRRLLPYRVAADERLVDIARRYAVDLESLARENDLPIDAVVSPGAVIHVSALVTLPGAAPATGLN